jgi:hypothetical protein
VIRGPLQGLVGRFVRRAADCRLVLAVNLIQQAAAVQIAAADVTVMNATGCGCFERMSHRESV